MNTNSKSIVTLFVIVLLSILLSACNNDGLRGSVNFVVKAGYSQKADIQSLRASARFQCDLSQGQQVINALNGEVNPQTAEVDGMTIDQWLDSKMGQFTCISK